MCIILNFLEKPLPRDDLIFKYIGKTVATSGIHGLRDSFTITILHWPFALSIWENEYKPTWFYIMPASLVTTPGDVWLVLLSLWNTVSIAHFTALDAVVNIMLITVLSKLKLLYTKMYFCFVRFVNWYSPFIFVKERVH